MRAPRRGGRARGERALGERALAGFAALCLLLLAAACEKETHRAARKAFQDILAGDLSPAGRASALEAFVRDYPEPKTNPHLTRACSMLASHHARSGRADIAASWYERAIRADPDDPDLLNALGYHYAKNRMNLDRAVSVLEQAVRLAEEHRYSARRQGFIKDSLGWAYRMRGDLPLSVALLEEAVRLAPGVPIIREHLADAYHAIGERERAVSVYLDLYLKGRATDSGLRDTIRAIGLEGGPAYSRDLDRRVEAGLRDIAAADRQDAESAGATLVDLTAADGHRLFGSLFRPRAGHPPATRGSEKRTGGILLLHALGSSRGTCTPQAAALAARGLVALALDLRGHGASVSEALPDAHAFSNRLAENLKAADRDVRAALAFLARQPGVDARRIGVVGAGLGALLAARAVLDEAETGSEGTVGVPRPAALVLLSPWGRADAYRELLAGFDPRSLLLVAGSEEGAPLATVQALAAPGGAPAPRSIVVDGPGAHYGLAADRPDLAAILDGFLADRLAAPPRADE